MDEQSVIFKILQLYLFILSTIIEFRIDFPKELANLV